MFLFWKHLLLLFVILFWKQCTTSSSIRLLLSIVCYSFLKAIHNLILKKFNLLFVIFFESNAQHIAEQIKFQKNRFKFQKVIFKNIKKVLIFLIKKSLPKIERLFYIIVQVPPALLFYHFFKFDNIIFFNNFNIITPITKFRNIYFVIVIIYFFRIYYRSYIIININININI